MLLNNATSNKRKHVSLWTLFIQLFFLLDMSGDEFKSVLSIYLIQLRLELFYFHFAVYDVENNITAFGHVNKYFPKESSAMFSYF